MSGFTLNVGFDAASLAAVGRMAAFEGYFAMRMMAAGEASLQALQREAVDYMASTFVNPIGALSDSLEAQMLTPWEGQMGSNSPYARRTNWGFSGMTDSLGRYYAEWPIGQYSDGYRWAEHSIEDRTPEIIGYYKTGIEQTILDLGGMP